jgi:DNA-binding response OmpR family regulator
MRRCREAASRRGFDPEFIKLFRVLLTLGAFPGANSERKWTMRVLYVDDDPSMTKSVELMLRTAGHSCDTTYLGERGVQLAHMNDYDVIILDIMLPDIDGYEVIERLRQAQVNVPILIQTGLVDRTEPSDAEAFGVDDVLIKPFDKRELIRHLRRAKSRAAKTEAIPAENVQPGVEDPEDQGVNKRRHNGIKTIKACEIQFGGIKTNGMVLSLSEGGAVVRLPQHMSDLPEYFTLKFLTGLSYDCRICWRAKDKIGIAFD